MAQPLLQVTAVAKAFGPVVALRAVDLSVAPGEVHALASFLRQQGAEAVTVADLGYVFARDNPLYAKLETGLAS